MRSLILAFLCACSGSPSVASTAAKPSTDRVPPPSPLIGRDTRQARLPLNFAHPSIKGVEWRCFEMQWAAGPVTESVGRCYRMTRTCQDSRQVWSRAYQVTDCQQHRHAACLRGKERASGDLFAICYVNADTCERARTNMLAVPDDIGFVSQCEVLD